MESDNTTLLWVVAAAYFLPSIISLMRSSKNFAAILVINLFLGWTLLGWVGSLAWAVVDPRKERKPFVLPLLPTPGVPAPRPPKPTRDFYG